MKLNSGSVYKVDGRSKRITISHGGSFSQATVNQVLTGWTRDQGRATHGPATTSTSCVRHIPKLYDHVKAINNNRGFWTGRQENIISIFRGYAAVVADPKSRHFVTTDEKRQLRLKLFAAYIAFFKSLDFGSTPIVLSMASRKRIMKLNRKYGSSVMDAIQGFFRSGRGTKQGNKKPLDFPSLPNTLLDFIEACFDRPYSELLAEIRSELKLELSLLGTQEATSAVYLKEGVEIETAITEPPPVTANRERSIEREIEIIKRILHEHPDLMDEEELKNAVYSIGDAVRAAIKKKIEHLENLI